MSNPFILVTHAEARGGKILIQLSSIMALGNLYGDINEKKSYIWIRATDQQRTKNTGISDDGCFVVSETLEEIMIMIDKAQALVHALENG